MTDIYTYGAALRNTLQYWLDIHTNPEEWANNWLYDTPRYMVKEGPVISNNFFSFDLLAGAFRYWCRRNACYFLRCPECHYIYEDYCDEHPDAAGRDVTPDELCAWYNDSGERSLMLDLISDDDIIDAMRNEGFAAYVAGVHPVIGSIIEEVQTMLADLDASASDPDEYIRAVLVASHTQHHSGNIAKDYGDYCDLDYHLVERVCEEGIAVLFESEINNE